VTFIITPRVAAIVAYLLIAAVLAYHLHRDRSAIDSADGIEMLGLLWPVFLAVACVEWAVHAQLRYRAGRIALQRFIDEPKGGSK
jgi:hypothetical protein